MSLEWPDGFDRTPASERTSYPGGFEVSRGRAFDSILDELEKMDAYNIEVQTNAPHTAKNPHRPYADRDPDDPAIVVYFERDSQQFAVPCDRWNNLRDNARSIASYLDAKRAIERYGVATVETEMSTQALPPGDGDEAVVAGGEVDDRAPHEVLEVTPDASEDTVEAVARRKLANTHPDQNEDGDREEYLAVQKAKKAMLGGDSA